MKRLVGTGLIAVVAAVVATTLVAAVARAAGVDFKVSGGEEIPLSGIAFMTGVFSLLGVVMAAAFLRWSARPAEQFLRTTVALTALSLIPPFLAGADPATTVTLVGLHLIAAAVMIPALSRSLRSAFVPNSAEPNRLLHGTK
ncbi:DUF6069 family protein [Aeromicrobium sp. NPDC092404]|uniref:DUF6069 family protein n=1 Tax=Aeromicrobium sp. NPDC092404 TaxID=3154976 RepID=UPI0034252CD3